MGRARRKLEDFPEARSVYRIVDHYGEPVMRGGAMRTSDFRTYVDPHQAAKYARHLNETGYDYTLRAYRDRRAPYRVQVAWLVWCEHETSENIGPDWRQDYGGA